MENLIMEKAEYIAQCAAIYKKVVADISDDLASSCAETCYENRDTDEPDDPEHDAHEDLACWDADE
jgi:hypothetical protein